MVRVKAPALSLEASGSLANALVFSKWKGRPYVRSLVTPANPKSGGQVGMRQMLKWLSQQWSGITAGPQATWETRANQQIISPFNAYVGYNMFRWRDFLAPSTQDPADVGDSAATIGTTTAVAGVRSITVTIPITTANDGWGVCVFRSLTTSFSTAFDNLIGIGLVNGTNDVVLVDSPLVPDTYYYNFREFTFDGQLGSEDGEINAVVA